MIKTIQTNYSARRSAESTLFCIAALRDSSDIWQTRDELPLRIVDDIPSSSICTCELSGIVFYKRGADKVPCLVSCCPKF